MFTSFNSFGMVGGTAVYAPFYPAKKPFINSLSFTSQDQIQQDQPGLLHPFCGAMQSFPISQFIGTF